MGPLGRPTRRQQTETSRAHIRANRCAKRDPVENLVNFRRLHHRSSKGETRRKREREQFVPLVPICLILPAYFIHYHLTSFARHAREQSSFRKRGATEATGSRNPYRSPNQTKVATFDEGRRRPSPGPNSKYEKLRKSDTKLN